MQKIPEQSVHMILCDLPYGTTHNSWDAVISFSDLWQQYLRVITPTGAIVLTGNQRFTFQLYNSMPQLYRYKWVWIKSNATNFINAHHRPMTAYEEVLVFSKSSIANLAHSSKQVNMDYYPQDLIPLNQTIKNIRQKPTGLLHKWNKPQQYTQKYTNYPKDVLYFKNENDKWHPTQKPVALFSYLIKTYTKQNQIVLDNCMGSGTTAIACLETKRHYIGFEQNRNYYQKSLIRINQHHNTETTLF